LRLAGRQFCEIDLKMADLESLSNEELRIQLLQFGFANMPVTSTTRTVLLKKLRNYLEGEKSKTRRETIHLTKYSSGEEDEVVTTKKLSRRTTIGLPLKSGPSSSGRQHRKSFDRAEGKPIKRTGRQAQQILVTDFESEETDEELKELDKNSRKKSKSPSLTRTNIVSTTYKNNTAVSEPEEAEDGESPTPPLIEEKKSRRLSPLRAGLDIRKRTTLIIRDKMDSDTNTSPKKNRPSLSTSYNNFTSPTHTKISKYAAVTEMNGIEVDADYKSPYLSDFTRRLSQLKAEPLTPSQMKPAIPKGTGVYYRTSKNSQIPMNQSPDTLSASVIDFFRSLASYRLTFLGLVSSLIILFFYVIIYM